MDEQNKIRTAAELEAEARERAKAEIAGQKTVTAEAQPGQPEVVQHNKPKSKRTLIVAIISLLALAGLAAGGDYLMDMAKGDKSDKKEETKAPKSNSMTTSKERSGMGRDTNPFEGQDTGASDKDEQPQSQPQQAASAPVSFSKVSALAGSAASYSPASQHSASLTPAATVAPVDPTADATLSQCKKVLVRAPDGRLYCPESGTVSSGENGQQDDGIARVTGVKRLSLDPNLYIPVDRHIPCTMMQRFVSDVAGRITCTISEDVYSASNFVRLIPAGSIARLIYKTGTLKNGMGRMFIAASEIRTPEPDALTIPMINSQAVGQLGENGIAGWIDEHWWERIGNTILLGTVQDFAAAAADAAPGKDRNTDYTENTRAATGEMAKAVLDNSLNIPPTMYLNQGDVIGLTTGSDIDFSGVYKLQAR